MENSVQDRGVVLTGKAIDHAQLCATLMAVKLEMAGFQRSRRSVTAVVKERYGLNKHWTKRQVYIWLYNYREKFREDHAEEIRAGTKSIGSV